MTPFRASSVARRALDRGPSVSHRGSPITMIASCMYRYDIDVSRPASSTRPGPIGYRDVNDHPHEGRHSPKRVRGEHRVRDWGQPLSIAEKRTIFVLPKEDAQSSVFAVTWTILRGSMHASSVRQARPKHVARDGEERP